MLKVAFHQMHMHPGYHYELLKTPPPGIQYYVHSEKKYTVPWEAVCGDIEHWKDHVQYGRFNHFYDQIPIFPKGVDLIHSHHYPVLNETPYVMDLDLFYYPYLIDGPSYERIKKLEALQFPSDQRIYRPGALSLVTKIFGSPFCKKIISWTEGCRQYMFDFIREEKIRNKIELLYPAVRNINFKRKEHGRTVLLYVGGSTKGYERKGGEEVLEIFDILSREYNNIQLNFVGFAPEEVVKRYGKEPNVAFHGFLNKKSLFEMYQASDIFILPTREDGFPMSILEAMNFGLPVITTTAPYLPPAAEIVAEGISGFLVGRTSEKIFPGSAIGKIDREIMLDRLRRLIEDRALRRKMGDAGKEEIASGKFCLRKRNARLKKIYEEASGSS